MYSTRTAQKRTQKRTQKSAQKKARKSAQRIAQSAVAAFLARWTPARRCVPLAASTLAATALAATALAACTPTVRVATDDPITINMNVNIKHEILVKVDRDLDEVFAENSDIF